MRTLALVAILILGGAVAAAIKIGEPEDGSHFDVADISAQSRSTPAPQTPSFAASYMQRHIDAHLEIATDD